MGTAEVESALVAHESVAEAAVVGFPHEVKGEGFMPRYPERRSRIFGGIEGCLEATGPRGHRAHCHPDSIHWAPALPKTRSGKIMRRILRKIATGENRPDR